MALINDRYELIRIIGKGGFGTTWYARDVKLDMPVAVKELSDTDPSRKAKFLREARTLARFAREPGIVNVRDYLEYNGKAYMVMEYLDGADLNTKIAEGGPISFDAAYELLRPVIQILGKLHAEGIIHRDVSPDNIRMQNDGTIKLLDFGAAWNTTTPADATTTITVKPGYAPYEQYAGKEQQGPFTDVYAVCATLYKCITGVTPPDSLKRAFYDEIKAPSLLGAKISPAAEGILLKGLAVNPPDRIRTMEELAQRFDEALGKHSPKPSGAIKSSMGGAGSAGSSGGRAFRSSAGRRNPEDGSGLKNSVGKGISEEISRTQDHSTQGYDPEKYAQKDRTAQGYAPRKYGTSDQTAQGYTPQRYASADRNTQGYAPQNSSRPEQAGQTYAAPDYTVQNQSAQNYAAQNQPAQEYNSQTSRSSAADKSDAKKKKHTKSPDSGKRRVRMPKKTIIALIALLAACVGVVFFIFRGGSTKPYTQSSSPDYAKIDKATVTADQLKAIEADEQITTLRIANSTLSDDMITEVSKLTHIETLIIEHCSGFTTLDPLADAPALTRLELQQQFYSKYIEGSSNLDGTKLFTRDFTNIRILTIINAVIDGGTECLKHFPNLETLTLSLWQPYSIAFMANMPNIVDVQLYDPATDGDDYLDLSGSEADFLYGHPKLARFRAEDANLSDLGWAAECADLYQLDASNGQISDLSPLADHKKLKYLTLRNHRIESVLPLSGCEDLGHVDLGRNPLTTLDGLGDCGELEELTIDNTYVKSLAPLAGCIKLAELNCRNAQVDSLSGVESLPLTNLYADGNRIADLSPLSANGTMEYLTVSDNLLTSLAGCEQMIRLKECRAARNALPDIEGIMNSSGMESLDVRSNQITSISPLQNSFSSLKNLNISDNQISDISPLSVCTALEVLNADNNSIKSLSPLEGCASLSAVMAGSNALTDLTGLSGKPTLYAVLVDHNSISSLTGLEGSIKKLHYLDIGCNNITDIGPLTELSEKKVVLLAEKNGISDLSPLPDGLRYNALVLYGNPISDFTKLTELKDVNTISDKLYISWNENADMKQLGMTAFAQEMHIISPLDKRGAIEVAVKEGHDEKPAANIPIKPTYLSEEEADAELTAWRADLRDTINGESSDDEDSESDGSSAESGTTSEPGESSAESGSASEPNESTAPQPS